MHRIGRIGTGMMSLGALVCAACANTVSLSDARFPRMASDTEVEVIDGSGMSRPELERTFAQFDVIARAHAMVAPEATDRLERELEKAKGHARGVGGDTILWLLDSQQVAVIMQDVRYAGPDDAVVMYLMLRKGG